MENLTNMIEAILFASGRAVPIGDITEKLGVSEREIKSAIAALREKYQGDAGICLLEFNRKIQLATNPAYRDQVASVLNPIREKELTKTVLECAAIIAYKQPVTRTEIELLRGVNSDYAVNVLLELGLIYPCGRKDAVGHPVLFATTDEFLKRFKLTSLEELPDYDSLVAMIRSSAYEERDSYLYARSGEAEEEETARPSGEEESTEETGEDASAASLEEGGYDLPDFLRDLNGNDLVKIS